MFSFKTFDFTQSLEVCGGPQCSGDLFGDLRATRLWRIGADRARQVRRGASLGDMAASKSEFLQTGKTFKHLSTDK